MHQKYVTTLTNDSLSFNLLPAATRMIKLHLKLHKTFFSVSSSLQTRNSFLHFRFAQKKVNRKCTARNEHKNRWSPSHPFQRTHHVDVDSFPQNENFSNRLTQFLALNVPRRRKVMKRSIGLHFKPVPHSLTHSLSTSHTFFSRYFAFIDISARYDAGI